MSANSSNIFILWDDSQIWGVLAVRALQALHAPCVLTRASDIAADVLERERPSLLVVPGGNARHKSLSLGAKGLEAIRNYVKKGGRYLGFCGGAGLALSGNAGIEGLGLCPWRRGHYDDRIQHFMSGHLHVSLPKAKESSPLIPPDLPESPRLPVWWPGRFEAEDHPEVSILASYERPAKDFWIADLPIADLPADTFAAWQDLYGLSFSPSFLAGQPCVVHGRYGKGEYVLSYSHLETPESPEANRWLAYLLEKLGGFSARSSRVPPWPSHGSKERWRDPILAQMMDNLEEVLETGFKHGLLFKRTDWLLGWRAGIPGSNLNSLWAALGVVIEREPGRLALALWEKRKKDLSLAMEVFSRGCRQYLLAERLAQTLAKIEPEALPPAFLKQQRDSLFGPPMQAEGLYKEIMEPLEDLAYLQLSSL